MKAYKVEILIIDHDKLGEKEIVDTIENTNYPNHCIYPQVVSIIDKDIGEWDDNHILNSETKWHDEYKKLFYL